ncbi:LIM domain and actin-binding protein 1 isoform X1 [Drosophila albomicans]|uniref:LIM domain and actin-binding protein 1 isoform X1 n=1 Tax=Drosophila albomicans TaxID=7291 RepID=A0A6P8XHB2_DROAB|nr:LIM domain and actin-binding protein 1 isoform X1 [Drosophila albomicans]
MESKNLITIEEKHLFSKSTKNTTKLKEICAVNKTETMSNVDNEIECIVNEESIPHKSSNQSIDSKDGIVAAKRKSKSKKSKRQEYDTQNISVKSSLNKFDALQKRNLTQVRSRECTMGQDICHDQTDQQVNCRQCNKPVYKMEEIIVQFKTEKGIYHKSCMRCKDCLKQLKFDNYQSHEGNLYCMVHFKLLFAPKVVEHADEPKPRKTELIIRESQPTELPPDVVRASDKPDLGLDELHQLNVRSRFQVFENGQQKKQEDQPQKNMFVRRTNSVLKQFRFNENNPNDNGEFDVKDSEDAENDADLILSKKCTQRERPIGIGDAMNDIKTRFENGNTQLKEERREERKHEIQNIRSRLFLGKQAKIKEMYQQAVAESEQVITSVGKKPDVNIGLMDARSIKNQFENGEIFAEKLVDSMRSNVTEDAEVFESGISKKSRSIFMEIDANMTSTNGPRDLHIRRPANLVKELSGKQLGQEIADIDVVKCSTQAEDVKIATDELSQKFKFFETYRDNDNIKNTSLLRTTPPREVAKLSAINFETENLDQKQKSSFFDNVLQKTQTTSTMLNKFREMELEKTRGPQLMGPRPLKCFTPPPLDDEHHYNISSEEDTVEEESDECENDEALVFNFKNDAALMEAKNAARAKQLRAKFEKWQDNEIKRELNEGLVDIYSQQVSDDSTIESAKTIRERFENMATFERKSQSGPRNPINRFV